MNDPREPMPDDDPDDAPDSRYEDSDYAEWLLEDSYFDRHESDGESER